MAWRYNAGGYEQDYPPPYEPEYRESDTRYTRDYGPVPNHRVRRASAGTAPQVLGPPSGGLQFIAGERTSPSRPFGGAGIGAAILRTYDSVRDAKRRHDGRVALLRATVAVRHAREVLAGMDAMPPVEEYFSDLELEMLELRAVVEDEG